jgi:hypothetical protein
MGPENRKKPAKIAGKSGKTTAAQLPETPVHVLRFPVPKPLIQAILSAQTQRKVPYVACFRALPHDIRTIL